jgi:hypothetical protein
MKLMLEVALICDSWKEYRRQNSDDSPSDDSPSNDWEKDQLIHQTIELDTRLHGWYQDRGSDWTCSASLVTLDNRPEWQAKLLKHPGAPKAVYGYSDSLVALDMNIFRATWLHLFLTMLEYFPQAVSSQQETPMASRMFNIIDDMCATIPYTLQITASGRGDPQNPLDVRGQRGHHLLFPLLICGRCFQRADVIQEDTEGRRYWIEAVSRFANEELGYAVVPLKR